MLIEVYAEIKHEGALKKGIPCVVAARFSWSKNADIRLLQLVLKFGT
jgi:hypothetical protein